MSVLSWFGDNRPTFLRGGIHPNEFKELTSRIPIEDLPTPEKVYVHLSQHIGAPAVPVVEKKSFVKKGQLIAEDPISGAPLHAPICGVIASIGDVTHPNNVSGTAITIKYEKPEDGIESLEFPENPEWQNLPPSDMLEKIKSAGIVGLGGAAFPTFRKLKLPEQAKVDTLVINGAECEPYLTSDHRMMLESPEAIVWGSWLIAKTIGVHTCIIGIEDNKTDAAEKLKSIIAQLKPEAQNYSVEIDVKVVRTRYPQGSEKQLIQAVLGRNVPKGGLPMHVGVVVQNVATAAACLDAIRFNRPLLERIVTVSGLGINTPKNLRVPVGTNLTDIISYCGGLKQNVVKIISGGPMMGRTLVGTDIPTIKGTGGLLFLTAEETNLEDYQACIQCGECVDHCPLGLEPNRISLLVESGHPLDTQKFGTHECFECGCCSYSCPSNRPLVQFIQVAKAAYRREKQMLEQLHKEKKNV